MRDRYSLSFNIPTLLLGTYFAYREVDGHSEFIKKGDDLLFYSGGDHPFDAALFGFSDNNTFVICTIIATQRIK